MNNALSRISNSIFGNREMPTEEPVRPTPKMLGSGMASNAATGLLMHEYRNLVAEAEAMGEEFPSFEEWILQRR